MRQVGEAMGPQPCSTCCCGSAASPEPTRMEDTVGGLLSRGILNAQNLPFVTKILKCLIKKEEGRDFPLLVMCIMLPADTGPSVLQASAHWIFTAPHCSGNSEAHFADEETDSHKG